MRSSGLPGPSPCRTPLRTYSPRPQDGQARKNVINQIASTVSTQAEPPLAGTDLKAPLNFIRRQNTKPVFHSAALTSSQMKFFFDPEAHTVPISDMRESAETLSVDREGFELLRHTTAVEDLYDDDAVEQVYYPGIEALLRRRFGAGQVVIFDVTRRSDDGTGAQNPDGRRGPARSIACLTGAWWG